MSWLPNWLTGHDETAYQEGLEADRKNAAITEDLKRRGLITDADYQIAQEHYAAAAAYDPDAAIQDAFEEGWDEGADNIRNAVGSTINAVVGTPLKLIPWQLWLAAGIYLAFRLGLFDGVLKGVLKKGRG